MIAFLLRVSKKAAADAESDFVICEVGAWSFLNIVDKLYSLCTDTYRR